MTEAQYRDLCKQVMEMDDDRFKDLLSLVQEEQKYRERQAMSELRIGDLVSFNIRRRRGYYGPTTLCGMVKRIGRSMVHVTVDKNFGVATRWRVSPSLIKKIDAVLEEA